MNDTTKRYLSDHYATAMDILIEYRNHRMQNADAKGYDDLYNELHDKAELALSMFFPKGTSRDVLCALVDANEEYFDNLFRSLHWMRIAVRNAETEAIANFDAMDEDLML